MCHAVHSCRVFLPERPRALQEANLRLGRGHWEAVEAPGKSLPLSRPGFPPLEQRLLTEPEQGLHHFKPRAGLGPSTWEMLKYCRMNEWMDEQAL